LGPREGCVTVFHQNIDSHQKMRKKREKIEKKNGPRNGVTTKKVGTKKSRRSTTESPIQGGEKTEPWRGQSCRWGEPGGAGAKRGCSPKGRNHREPEYKASNRWESRGRGCLRNGPI